MSTKAQKAPANNICTGWEQRSARWSAALWREDANFVSVVMTQRGLGSARWMEELNSGFAPLLLLRLDSSAAAFVSLLFLFSWPNIQILGGGWLKVYQPAPVRSSDREKNVFTIFTPIDKIDSNWHIWHVLNYIIQSIHIDPSPAFLLSVV